MSHPGDHERLRHAIEAADKIQAHSEGESLESLRANERLQFTLVRPLEILGEACNHVSKPTRVANPAIPWQDVVSMRHRLIHGYFDINLEIVWDTAVTAVPPLRDQLADALAGLQEG
jgi:uncharacterized protein with HEPN domain